MPKTRMWCTVRGSDKKGIVRRGGEDFTMSYFFTGCPPFPVNVIAGPFFTDGWDCEPYWTNCEARREKSLHLYSSHVGITESEDLASRQKLRCFDWRETPMVGCNIIITTRFYAENNQGVFPMAYDSASPFMRFHAPAISRFSWTI